MTNKDSAPTFLLQQQPQPKITLHHQKQTPANFSRQITLKPELEPLHTVIMLQHDVLEAYIIELGTISVDSTKIIQKKKDSTYTLQTEGRIPNGLRLKCELTTSPAYAENKIFKTLKSQLDELVKNFKQKGMEIIKEWSITHIQLLLQDCCNTILIKAQNILDGIWSYHQDLVGCNLSWPTIPTKKILLLIIKILFDTDYTAEKQELLEYFEMPPEKILLTASKILNNTDDDEIALSMLTSIKVENINQSNDHQIHFLNEVISQFTLILSTATIALWNYNKELIRESNASQKMKANLESKLAKSATEATALAITKASTTMEKQMTITWNYAFPCSKK